MGLITHTAPSFVIAGALVFAVVQLASSTPTRVLTSKGVRHDRR